MHFWDARINYRFSSVTLKLGVKNLLNYNYAPRESDLMPPRTYILGLQGQL